MDLIENKENKKTNHSVIIHKCTFQFLRADLSF